MAEILEQADFFRDEFVHNSLEFYCDIFEEDFEDEEDEEEEEEPKPKKAKKKAQKSEEELAKEKVFNFYFILIFSLGREM